MDKSSLRIQAKRVGVMPTFTPPGHRFFLECVGDENEPPLEAIRAELYAGSRRASMMQPNGELVAIDPRRWGDENFWRIALHGGFDDRSGNKLFLPITPAPAPKQTIAAEKACEAWLIDVMKDPKSRTKPQWLAHAQERFNGLSDKAFGRAWSAAARAPTTHATWDKSGPVARSS